MSDHESNRFGELDRLKSNRFGELDRLKMSERVTRFIETMGSGWEPIPEGIVTLNRIAVHSIGCEFVDLREIEIAEVHWMVGHILAKHGFAVPGSPHTLGLVD